MLRKLSLLIAALGLAAASYLPGRAQEDTTGRYAFADSTLLRDTLGLRFDHLFQLADSLQTTPDTLRALSIRYRIRLRRLVFLADSMDVPVDSLGPALERERFNPLAARSGRAPVNTFNYTTSYNLVRSTSTWNNAADYNLTAGALFVHNTTNINLIRLESLNFTTVQQTRTSTTEAGWRLSPQFSMGGRAILNRFNTDDPSSIVQQADIRSEYQVSVHHRRGFARGFTTQLDAFVGALDQHNTEKIQKGLSTELNLRTRQVAGRWLTHEVTGYLSTDFARLQLVSTGAVENTPDVVGRVNGTLTVFNGYRTGLRTTYRLENSNTAQADTAISRLKQSVARLDATLRTRIGTDGYVNLTPSLANTHGFTVLNGPSSRRTAGISTDGQADWYGWGFEGRFQTAHADVSSGTVQSGYTGTENTRSLEGAANRRLLKRVTTRLSARIGLTSYRYEAIGNLLNPPYNGARDLASQSYRIEGNLALTAAASTGLSLEVGRDQTVYIRSSATGTNGTNRSYSGVWTWTYRLMTGLTATQANTMTANYISYDFLTGADRATFSFATTTTLNAVITPRFAIDLTHTSSDQPGGNWTRFPDGFYYLQPSDRSRNFSLTTRIRYSPSPALSFTLTPAYRAADTDGAANGVILPTRRGHTLQFDGSANLNLPVGRGGLLTGSLGRTYVGDRSTDFTSGIPKPTPLSQYDYWTASLQFSWKPS